MSVSCELCQNNGEGGEVQNKKYSSLYGANVGEKCLMSLVWWYFWSDLLQISINLSTVWTRCLHSRAHLVLSLFIFFYYYYQLFQRFLQFSIPFPAVPLASEKVPDLCVCFTEETDGKNSFKVYFCGCCDKASLITLQGKLPSRLEE